MHGPFGRQAVVIGAGIGGLAAAKAVAPFFENVAVLDRDVLPDAARPRQGVPQGRHLHVLLAGGSRALEALFPGLERKLFDAGAVKVRLMREMCFELPGYDPFPRRDLGLQTIAQSRPLLEWVCRTALERRPNVEFRAKARVTGLLPSENLDSVVGVQYEDGEALRTITADLVIDASGRAAPTLALLDAIGCPRPAVSEIGADMAYATAVFKTPRDAGGDWKVLSHQPAKPHSSRSGVIASIEGGQWIVSLSGAHGDGPPSDLDGFRAYAATFRTQAVHDAIRGLQPIGDIARFKLPSSVRRHFSGVERFPRGLIPIGDSICRFNPIFGQGMSVAAQEAVALGEILDSRRKEDDPLDGLAPAFFAEADRLIETPWGVALQDFCYPRTRGERPADFERGQRFQAALYRLMAQEPETQKLGAEVAHLLRPRGVMRDPDLVARVMALIPAS